MAKDVASESIMASSKLKPLLALSKKEPVQAAIGLTSDGEGLILLDKRAKPRKMLLLLKASAAKAKVQLNMATLRFGRAEVDPDYDPTMVRLFVNKDAPGTMRPKLVEVVKRSAFQKVEINVDPSLEDEPDDDASTAAEGAAAGPAAGTAAAPAPPVSPQLNDATIKRILASLAGRIPQAANGDMARHGMLLHLATDANTWLKAGNLPEAVQALARLRAGLDAPAEPVLAIWNEAKETVDRQLDQLYQVLRKAGVPVLAEVADEIRDTLEAYRTSLVASLMDYDRSAGPDRAAAGQAALKVVGDCRARLSLDVKVIAADTNPFAVPVTAGATLGQALERIAQQIGGA